MHLEKIVKLCQDLIPDIKKPGTEGLQIYDDGIFRVEGERDDFLDGKELTAFYKGTQVLLYRENYANNYYRPLEGCEDYLNSHDFMKNHVKHLLRQ